MHEFPHPPPRLWQDAEPPLVGRERRRAAVHAAGEVIAGALLIAEDWPLSIVLEDRRFDVYTRWHVWDETYVTEAESLGQAFMRLAGPEAERILLGEYSLLASRSIVVATSVLRQRIEAGFDQLLVPSAGAYVSAALDELIARRLVEGRRITSDLMSQQRTAVSMLAATLDHTDELHGEELTAAVRAALAAASAE
jgi:hypothetical protein